MLSDTPVTAVLPSTDLDRSEDFYSNKLGLKLVSADGPLMYEAGQGTRLNLYYRPEGVKPEHTVAQFRVKNIKDVVDALVKRSVVFEDYPGTKDHILESGPSKLAWFKDPDGNTIALDGYDA